MAVIASPEFLSLCEVQLRLLVQQMEESSAAIYIAEVAMGESEGAVTDGVYARKRPDFAPIVSYPESIERWVENFEDWRSDERREGTEFETLALPGSADDPLSEKGDRSWPELRSSNHPSQRPSQRSSQRSSQQPDQQLDQRLVVPLVYTDVVVGLLVTVRCDRPWRSEEQQHIEAVAQMLAAGCVLERRNQWLQQQISTKRELQSRQSEIFHNLLHQFRNPLTAVTTFGQLLVRRLEPEDPNNRVATGIVRESKRLREMVAHFDETVAVGDADLADEVAISPPLLPPAQTRPPLGPSSSSPLSLPSSSLPSSSLPSSPQTAESAAIGTATNTVHIDDERQGFGLGHALTLSAQYLPDIVEPVLAVAGIVATEKGVQLHTQVAPDTPLVWGEEEALCEVINNLIDNAIKYSPAGAEVWVQTGVSRIRETDSQRIREADSQRIRRADSQHSLQGQYQGVVIGDTGPGIPADDLARLFERNYRGVQAEGDIPGTGLGLAIAQSLVAEMQGFIEVISPAAGTPWLPASAFDAESGPGTAFIVWLLEVERRAVD
ncbi:MAG: ATP-binding protein [Cyanobacteria bacterium P01_D01_bin.1]